MQALTSGSARPRRGSALRYGSTGLQLVGEGEEDEYSLTSSDTSDDAGHKAMVTWLLPYKHTIAYWVKATSNWKQPWMLLSLLILVNGVVVLLRLAVSDWPFLTVLSLFLILTVLMDHYSVPRICREFTEYYLKRRPSHTHDDDLSRTPSSIGLYSLGVAGVEETLHGRSNHMLNRGRSSSISGGIDISVLPPQRDVVVTAMARASMDWATRSIDTTAVSVVESLAIKMLSLLHRARRAWMETMAWPLGSARGLPMQLLTLSLCLVAVAVGETVSGFVVLLVVLNAALMLPLILADPVAPTTREASWRTTETLESLIESSAAIAGNVASELSELRVQCEYLESQNTMLEDELANQAAQYEEEASELARVAQEQLEQVAARHETVLAVWRRQLQDCQQRLVEANQTVARDVTPTHTAEEREDDMAAQQQRMIIVSQLVSAGERLRACADTAKTLLPERVDELEAVISDLAPCADQVSVIAGVIVAEAESDQAGHVVNSAVRRLVVPVGSIPGAMEWLDRAAKEKQMRERMVALTPRKKEKKATANRDFETAIARLCTSLNEVSAACVEVVNECHVALGLAPPPPPEVAKDDEERSVMALYGRLDGAF